MKTNNNTTSNRKTIIKNKIHNNTHKFNPFKNTFLDCGNDKQPRFINKAIIKTYNFTPQPPSQEIFKQSFKRFYNDTIGIKRKSKLAKEKINLKLPIMQSNTLEDLETFQSSLTISISNNENLMIKVRRI